MKLLRNFINAIVLSWDYFNYYRVLFFGIHRELNPTLQLSVLLIKLDGVEKTSETKRIIKFLDNHIAEKYIIKAKLQYYKKQFDENLDLDRICKKINWKIQSVDKVILMKYLVYLSLTDRLMTDNELEFLKYVTKKIGLHQRTLKAILKLHIYVTEEDIRNQKMEKNYVTSSSHVAFSVLGLDSSASMEEVKESYRELVKIYHPDKLKSKNKEEAKIKFQAISDAYQFIKNKLT